MIIKKEQFLLKISEKSHVRADVCQKVSRALVKSLRESLQNGQTVTLSGLGTFRIKARKAKPARNLQTGEAVYLPAGKKISFKPSLSFKRLLKTQTQKIMEPALS